MLTKTLKVRFQKDKKKVVVNVVPPDYKSEQEMRVAYAKSYRQAIQQGVATRPSMLELMRIEKIWSETQENELTELTIHAALLEAALNEQEEQAKQKDLVLELTKVRSKIYELVSIKTLPLEHTAEQLAEDVRMDFYIATCTFDENGCRYFRSHEDFLKRRHEADAEKIYQSVVEELSKDNIEMLRQLPEHQWLISNKFMDRDGHLLSQEMEEAMEAAGVSPSADTMDMLKKE